MYSSCDKNNAQQTDLEVEILEKLQKLFNGERHFTTTLKSHIFTCFVEYRSCSSVREWVGRSMSFFLAFSFVIQLLASPELQISKDDSQD